MGSITDATLLHHVCIVLLSLWLLSSFECCHPVAYFLSLIYLYLIHEGYVLKLRKKLQFEEKRESNQRRVLSDSETVRWLNSTIEKIWPICMEEIVSQKLLLPIVPWFLNKYKPWTAREIEVQSLYLGRAPPIFTDMRVLQNSCGDDHLVLELGMNFRTAEDMSAILAVKLRKRLGFGMSAKLHLLGMHIEGKVLVGVKFIRGWPFISRLRVCFAGPPYCQMTVKPIFTHGLNVTEVPGIAGWIDNLLALVFEQTLVEPNMLVVDVEKLVSAEPENWFSVDAKEPIAHAIVEVLEAAEMKPSDLNGLADPYVKGQLGPYRFRTKTQKKTLAPKWHEEFKVPITSWEGENLLLIEVRDKDRIFDDMMGTCSVSIHELKGGQRHDLWLPLQNIKMGRLHLAVTVLEGNEKVGEPSLDAESPETDPKEFPSPEDSAQKGSFSSCSEKSPKVADKFEPIDVEGKPETGVWIHHPGSEVAQVWEPRKGKSSHNLNSNVSGHSGEILGSFKSTSQNDGSSTDENSDSNKPQSVNPVKRGFRKIGSVFHRSPREEEKPSNPPSLGEQVQSPHDNIRPLNSKDVGVKLIIDDNIASPPLKTPGENDKELLLEGNGLESPRPVKEVAKSILKHAGKSARGLKMALSRKASRKMKAEAILEDSSDDESFSSSTDNSNILAENVLVIPGKAVSTPSPVSGNDSSESKDGEVQKITLPGNDSSKLKDGEVQKKTLPGNESSKLKDGDVQKKTLPGSESFKSKDSNIVLDAKSGNDSFKQVK